MRNYLIRLLPRVLTRKRCYTGLASPTDCLPYLIGSRFKSEAGCRCYPWLYPRFPASCPFRVHHVRSFPGAASGTCFTSQIPLGQAPSLHHLRRSVVPPCGIEETLFDGFLGTIGLSDFPQPSIAVVLLRFTTPTSPCHGLRPVHGISRFPLMKLTHMPQVSDSGEPK